MKFSGHVHGALRMNLTDFGHGLTFPPTAGQIFAFPMKYLNIYKIYWLKNLDRHSWFPDSESLLKILWFRAATKDYFHCGSTYRLFSK